MQNSPTRPGRRAGGFEPPRVRAARPRSDFAAGTPLAPARGMSGEHYTSQTPRPVSFGEIKFLLLGFLFDFLLVAAWFLCVMVKTAGAGCDGVPCTAAVFFVSRIVFALKLGVGLLIFLWIVILPLFVAPPFVGFFIDYTRYARRLEGRA